jgi:hypothetical protein
VVSPRPLPAAGVAQLAAACGSPGRTSIPKRASRCKNQDKIARQGLAVSQIATNGAADTKPTPVFVAELHM